MTQTAREPARWIAAMTLRTGFLLALSACAVGSCAEPPPAPETSPRSDVTRSYAAPAEATRPGHEYEPVAHVPAARFLPEADSLHEVRLPQPEETEPRPCWPEATRAEVSILGETNWRTRVNLAVDAGSVYLPLGDGIDAIALESGKRAPFVRDQLGPVAVTVSLGRIFWLNTSPSLSVRLTDPHGGAAIAVMRHDRDLGVRTLYAGLVNSDVLVVHDERIYWLDRHARLIASVDVNGGHPQALATWPPAVGPGGIVLGTPSTVGMAAHGGRLYWAVHDSGEANGEHHGLSRVMSVATTGMDPRVEQAFADGWIGPGPRGIAVVGEDLLMLFHARQFAGLAIAQGIEGDVVGGTQARSLSEMAVDREWVYAASAHYSAEPRPTLILRMPVHGGEPCAVAEAEPTVGALSVAEGWLTWIETPRGTHTSRIRALRLPAQDH